LPRAKKQPPEQSSALRNSEPHVGRLRAYMNTHCYLFRMESMKEELLELKASSASFDANTARIRDIATDLSSLKAGSSKALSRTMTGIRRMAYF